MPEKAQKFHISSESQPALFLLGSKKIRRPRYHQSLAKPMGRRMASTKRKQVVPTQQARTLTICANFSRGFTCGGIPQVSSQNIAGNKKPWYLPIGKSYKWWDFEHCHLSLPTAGNQLKVNLKVLQAGPAAVFKLSVSCMVAWKVKNSISWLKIKRFGKKNKI